jgi:hypothetical protein
MLSLELELNEPTGTMGFDKTCKAIGRQGKHASGWIRETSWRVTLSGNMGERLASLAEDSSFKAGQLNALLHCFEKRQEKAVVAAED